MHAAAGYDRHGHLKIAVRVTGVPPGEEARLRATTSSGDLHSAAGCDHAGTSWTCTATSRHDRFFFAANTQSRPTLTFTVSPPQGWTDPATGNNTSTIHVTGDHHAG